MSPTRIVGTLGWTKMLVPVGIGTISVSDEWGEPIVYTPDAESIIEVREQDVASLRARGCKEIEVVDL